MSRSFFVPSDSFSATGIFGASFVPGKRTDSRGGQKNVDGSCKNDIVSTREGFKRRRLCALCGESDTVGISELAFNGKESVLWTKI